MESQKSPLRRTTGGDETGLRARTIARSRDRILRDGFSRLTVDEIASDLGISKKTFYTAFEGKEELIIAVIDSFLAEMRGGLDEVMRRRQPFPVKFRKMMLTLGSKARRIGHPFLDDLQKYLPDQWEKIREFRRARILSEFSTLLDQGLKEGSVRPGIHKQVFLTGYLAAIEAVVNPSFLVNQSVSASDAIAGIIRLFFQGVLTPRAAKQAGDLTDETDLIQTGDDHR